MDTAFHPEDRSRSEIDAKLQACGWAIQNRRDINLGAAQGVAVREFHTTAGPVDYALFVDRTFCGVVEAKADGVTLSGFSEQASGYLSGAPNHLPGLTRRTRSGRLQGRLDLTGRGAIIMAKRRRGRPSGTSGRAAVLSPSQIKLVLRLAAARGRHADRAEVALALSLGLGLRTKELAGVKWTDVYDAGGRVRDVMHLKAAYTKGGRVRDAFLSSPALRRVLARYGEAHWLMATGKSSAALLPSQKGGPMTACSMARFIKALYSEAGIAGASSHSGRRPLITRLAERGVDLKAIAQIAGHTSIRTTAMYVESNPTRLARILQDVTF